LRLLTTTILRRLRPILQNPSRVRRTINIVIFFALGGAVAALSTIYIEYKVASEKSLVQMLDSQFQEAEYFTNLFRRHGSSEFVT